MYLKTPLTPLCKRGYHKLKQTINDHCKLKLTNNLCLIIGINMTERKRLRTIISIKRDKNSLLEIFV